MEKCPEENATLDSLLSSFLKETNERTGDSPTIDEKDLSRDQEIPFLSSFLVDLVQNVKNTLATIKNFTLLSMEKYDDVEFRKYSYRNITEDIKKIDSVLNSLLKYININTPIVKSNTIHLLLEGILEANEKQLRDKNIRIIKRFDKDLPEISMHDEQMKFIFDSILQYAILLTPPGGTIGFLIKSFDIKQDAADKKPPANSKGGGYVLVVVGFVMGGKWPAEPGEPEGAAQAGQKEAGMGLILELVKEVIHKNRGTMTMKVDEKTHKTILTLRLPIERRKFIYYEPITI
jgi:nitrogen-specific signal transduction histidine kinase